MISRRLFGKKLIIGSVTLIASGWSALEVFSKKAYDTLPQRSIAPENRKWVMVIDLAKCDGCRECTKACNKMHFVPSFQEWIKVYEMTDNEETGPYFMPRPCMHCDNPPCVRACPVSATFKRTDGVVMMDQNRCIGCRNCMAQCPYSARFFNWGEPPHTAEELSQLYSMELNYPHRKGVVEKCTLCPHLLRKGKLPACAAVCPMGVIYFGDELEDAVTNSKGETIQFSKLIKKGASFRLMEELGTEPRIYYLPPTNRKYPSPEEKCEHKTQGKEGGI